MDVIEDDAEIEKQLYDLNQLFYPREHWSNPNPFIKKDVTDLLMLMYAGKRRGFLNIHEELIKTHRFEPYHRDKFPSEQDRELWLVAARRRGGDDLKEATWSALQYLRKRFPRAPIEAHSAGLPFCFVVRRRSLVLTAGNIAPEVMLNFMLREGLTCLGLAGDQMKPAPTFGEGYFVSTGRLCVRWVEFAAPLIAALQKLREACNEARNLRMTELTRIVFR
jgi:hypothetical protein